MAHQRRTSANISNKNDIGTGPYLARIISHLDPTFSGSLEVMLLREQGNKLGEESQTYQVRCASPFFGYTAYEYLGENSSTKSTLEAFNDTQKSYGMWFVPPDVGVTVLVIFVDGDPTQGYWIGCIPTQFANHMVPAIGGTTEVDISEADKKRLGWPKNPISGKKLPLPVAEINKRLNAKNDQQIDADKIKKALHPIADRFLEQGLLDDDVRGTTTTTSRREVPSMVFGISTPGPRDKRDGAKKGTIGTRQSPSTTTVPVSRLGGTQFVMDDGDERYQRKTPASTGPVEYADLLAGEKGNPTIPYNEYFRIRTRTGHQILMHNSEDLIYIGNARGTTWIELTSNGKIDIFAQDSISIHTENDLNIKADRDINMEAGRNINMRTETGRLHADIATDMEIYVGGNGQLTVAKNFDHVVGSNTKFTTVGNFDLKTSGNNKFTAGGNTDILSGGNHTETAVRIDMNGPVAKTAEAAEQVIPLKLHENIKTSVSSGWEKRYQASTINSIMKRVPMHEPWPLHENQAPQLLTPKDTDREV
jgi:hypothetical protein